MIRKKYIIFEIIFVICFYLLNPFKNLANYVYGQEVGNINENLSENINEEVIKEVGENVNIDEYISSLQKYVDENSIDNFNISELTESLIKSGSIDYKNIVIKILSLFSKELVKALSGAIGILIIIIIMSIISSLELEDKSDITKLTHLVCLIAIVVIMVSNLTDIIADFKKTITGLTTLMQIVSPFLMGVIIATGKITSTGIIKPMLLFLASAIGFIINYVVIPFICISVSLNIISNLSENLNLGKMSKLFNSSSIWIISVTLTIFLGILSLETTLTSSVDTLAVKATQSAVSNFVPVVGKFFSDSFETVVGATHVIANICGIIGIVVIFIIAIIPILKIASVMLIYTILASLVEPICKDDQIIKFISSFTSTYKTLLGILIGVSILFIISTGIILNLASSVTS